MTTQTNVKIHPCLKRDSNRSLDTMFEITKILHTLPVRPLVLAYIRPKQNCLYIFVLINVSHHDLKQRQLEECQTDSSSIKLSLQGINYFPNDFSIFRSPELESAVTM
jgi:hypothetical protein